VDGAGPDVARTSHYPTADAVVQGDTLFATRVDAGSVVLALFLLAGLPEPRRVLGARGRPCRGTSARQQL